MKKFDYNRIWFLTDIHFGLHASSMEWLGITVDYFESFFIPYLKKNKKRGDVLCILGDVYDNRQSINIKVFHNAKDIFKKIAEIIDIHIIVGNHDIYMKNSNEISSIDTLAEIPNIKIWKEPEVVQYGRRDVLLMPWRKDANAEAECVDAHEADYLFCHTDVRGMRYNSASKVDHGNSAAVYRKFNKVFSGHIHYRQHVQNIFMLGSPFEMSRSDAYNKKAIYIWDLEDEFCENVTIVENNHSPRHLKLHFEEIKDLPINEVKDLIHNNFVDIYVYNSYLIQNPISGFLHRLDGYARKLEVYVQYDESDELHHEIEDASEIFSMDINNLMTKYVKNKEAFDTDLKDKINNYLSDLYKETIEEIKF